MGWDVTDEIVVTAAPEAVWTAVLEQFAGHAVWAEPGWRVTRDPSAGPVDRPGATFRLTIRRAWRRGDPVRFRVRVRVEEVEPPRRVVTSVTGSFLGQLTWTLEAQSDATDATVATRVRVRFAGEPGSRVTRQLSRFVDLGSEHSRGARLVLAGLEQHLSSAGTRPKLGADG